jgi:3-methylcrotonyl-CoA carboxylase alpha subunit
LQGAGTLLLQVAECETLHCLRLTRTGAGWCLASGEIAYQLAGRIEGDVALLQLDGVAHRVPILKDGEMLSVALPAGRWQFRRRDPHAPPASASSAAGGLAAPIPGRVVQVLVVPGEAVSRGQVLVVLEAMKTELRITAPTAGEVGEVRCAAGETVEEGVDLVTLIATG